MIDITFDFTKERPGYWEPFWEKKGGLGKGGYDPDNASRTLQQYHSELWSKQLPCGLDMQLSCGSGSRYLTWSGFRFGSDLIIAGLRYERLRPLLEEVAESVPDYREYVENYVHRSYTIGGFIIFPKRKQSINQRKGCNHLIADRWDLTLECIRRYYNGEDSPLYKTLLLDKAFFDLFVDFHGYVEFFHLQDCVSPGHSKVNIWQGKGDFSESPFPKSVDEYLRWIDAEMAFLDKRNARIALSQKRLSE